ncbi:uncharacterized protein Z519_06088 [Cladophialophora bantiana CBS 173.52]|uniref:Zn(2)-C6 fungal-type domain-containing protein n=1 Tax=Cladophialophora bantiana (strain ATCC 10958 / CBS 173.52 / CDC B-1940 / NIH 8579) TaxID=1442370 RepID=A0A0D2HJN7_CLAB1|nr:uncharacterized protein Z519_06088 [Cladophialophora bantiana CBS 173.52]KIW93483.1 hypothetical protein Z519_06088 [Cladophialophora bantiana CBS 173.52]
MSVATPSPLYPCLRRTGSRPSIQLDTSNLNMCDQQQPSCGPCKHSKLVCGGYQRARIFVNSRPEHDQVVLTSPTALLLLERSLGCTALERKYLDFYWTTLLPNGQPFTPRAVRYSTTSWTGVVQDLGQRQGLVHLALLTNALGLLGQVSGQQPIIMQGWRLYGRSLQALAKSIPAKGQEGSDGLLAASGLLRAYEVYADIHLRKRSIFSSPAWKSIPWPLHPMGPRDKLLDIMIEVPALLEDLEGLLGCLSGEVETQALLRQQLEERCWLYHSQLQTWSANSGSSTIAFVEDKISNGPHESSKPSSEHFAMAHLGIIYLATYNIIHDVLWYVAGNGRAGLSACIDPRLYCRKIVMLMPFLQRPAVGAFFLNIAGFPAAEAVSFLARQDSQREVSEERRLLQKAFQGNRGTQLRNFLRT